MLNASGITGELSVLDNDTHRCTDNAEESSNPAFEHVEIKSGAGKKLQG